MYKTTKSLRSRSKSRRRSSSKRNACLKVAGISGGFIRSKSKSLRRSKSRSRSRSRSRSKRVRRKSSKRGGFIRDISDQQFRIGGK